MCSLAQQIHLRSLGDCARLGSVEQQRYVNLAWSRRPGMGEQLPVAPQLKKATKVSNNDNYITVIPFGRLQKVGKYQLYVMFMYVSARTCFVLAFAFKVIVFRLL